VGRLSRTKVYVDWQHVIIGKAVFNGVGAFHRTANLVWLRFQLFFEAIARGTLDRWTVWL